MALGKKKKGFYIKPKNPNTDGEPKVRSLTEVYTARGPKRFVFA